MNTVASANFNVGPLLIGIAFVVGLAFVGIFYGVLRRGDRRSMFPTEPQPPQARSQAWMTSEEFRAHDIPPDHGPGHADVESSVGYEEAGSESAPAVVPHDGRRRMPYEIRDTYPGPPT